MSPKLPWWKQKTTLTGVATILGAGAALITGTVALAPGLTTIAGALIAIFLRQGVEKAK